MLWLILGLALWAGAHFFKRALPKQREALGKAGRPLVAVVIVASVVMMVVGYRGAEGTEIYALPVWSWHLNNVLMVVALFLMDIGRVKGVTRHYIRHPMLLGIIIWSVAHLLVNGNTVSLILFGGLGAWALLEMAVISKAEGLWQRPEKGSIAKDGIIAVVAIALYALIVAIHYWLGHPAFVLF